MTNAQPINAERRAGASRRLLAAVGGAVFIAFIVANAPSSLLPHMLGFAKAGVGYQSTEGTVWRGAVNGVVAEGVALGDISYALHPLQLLTGRVAANVTGSGGSLVGGGEIVVGAGGRVTLTDAKATFDLESARRYAFLGEPLRGSLRADIKKIALGKRGCIDADATFWTDVLETPAARFNTSGMTLAGAGACDGDDLVVALSGAGEEGRVALDIRVTPAFTYQLAARAEPARAEVRRALEGLGFEPRDGALTLGARGAIRSVGA